MNILEIKNVSISYGNRKILNNINISVKEKEIISIMGKSGCGKSTLLSLMNGFLEENGGSYTGDVLLKGRNFKDMKLIEIRRKVATLFQDSRPFPMSIQDNILYPIEFYEGKIKDRKERVKSFLEMVNLYDEVKDKLNEPASSLSGGQKQRLCIARMLTVSPEILILDEPCSSLDIENALIIEGLIRYLSEKYAVILTTHSPEQSERLGGTKIILDDEMWS